MDAATLQAMAPLFVGLLITGLISGFMAGLFGIGGGAILVPALYELFARMDVDMSVRTHLAIGTSLAVIVPTAIRSVLSHHDRGAVDWKVLRGFAPWVVAGAGFGAFVADKLSGQALTLTFAVLAFANGLNMALRGASQVKGHWHPPRSVRAFLGLGTGLFSALMGIGGGTFAVLLLTLTGRDIREAVATGAGFGVLIAVPGVLGFMAGGANEVGLPPGSIGYVSLIGFALLAPTAMVTAHWGVLAAHRLDRNLLRRIFGVFLLAVAARLAWASFAHA